MKMNLVFVLLSVEAAPKNNRENAWVYCQGVNDTYQQASQNDGNFFRNAGLCYTYCTETDWKEFTYWKFENCMGENRQNTDSTEKDHKKYCSTIKATFKNSVQRKGESFSSIEKCDKQCINADKWKSYKYRSYKTCMESNK
eukprot:NODE_264_length_12431_cov_0.389556.p6 type:complete len:141 gc:universal NODE_264_length_12431_cov_0.389556:11171-11593(+)